MQLPLRNTITRTVIKQQDFVVFLACTRFYVEFYFQISLLDFSTTPPMLFLELLVMLLTESLESLVMKVRQLVLVSLRLTKNQKTQDLLTYSYCH